MADFACCHGHWENLGLCHWLGYTPNSGRRWCKADAPGGSAAANQDLCKLSIATLKEYDVDDPRT